MFCKKCGTNLPEDALFCEVCGTQVKRIGEPVPAVPEQEPIEAEKTFQSEAAEITPEAAAENIPADATEEIQKEYNEQQFGGEVYMGETSYAYPLEEAAPAKKRFPKWVIFAGAAAIVLIIVAIIALCGGGGSNDAFYQEMNFNNVAHLAYDDNRLYFIGEYTSDAEDPCLYSTDHKGLNKQLILDKTEIIRIRVQDGKIYYYDSANDKEAICVVDTDGKNDRTIISIDTFIDTYAVQNDKLYYQTENAIFCCDLYGNNTTKLIDESETFLLADGVIYYVFDDVIRAYNIKKGRETQLCRAEGANDLALDGRILYFACDSGLSCVDVKGDGAVTRVIVDDQLDSYIFFEDYIYYKQEFTTDEVEEIAEYFAEDSSEVFTYKLMFIGTGSLYRANRDGSDVREEEDSDVSIVFNLYTSPKGVYYRMTAWNDSITLIEFE